MLSLCPYVVLKLVLVFRSYIPAEGQPRPPQILFQEPPGLIEIITFLLVIVYVLHRLAVEVPYFVPVLKKALLTKFHGSIFYTLDLDAPTNWYAHSTTTVYISISHYPTCTSRCLVLLRLLHAGKACEGPRAQDLCLFQPIPCQVRPDSLVLILDSKRAVLDAHNYNTLFSI